ncbi:TolC family protein [uncultured Aquimarina sp.]|uniref:TolC family protein n=1 Tax=uncultured Aquimarina sp. TaxID=575652 RepID=UPI0026281649|nr:TolC family protein [uncultured Aquimarina sp.]
MKNTTLLLLLIFAQLLGYSQSSKTVTISILSDKSTAKTTQLLTKLQNEIRSVVSPSATVIFKDVLENRFDIETAKSNYSTSINSDADIILAFGLINTIVIDKEEQYPKPIILFGSANSDFYDFPEGQKTSETDNITYLIAPFSYTKDLDVFRSLFDYKRIGIIIDDFMIKQLPVKKIFDDYFAKKDSSYQLILLNKDGSLSTDLKGLDAVYLTGGFYLNDIEFKTLIKSINSKKLPSFSAFSKEDVKKGILASNQPETNIDQFFRRIALNVEAIVEGSNPSELPILLEYKNKLSLNFNTAKEIKFPLRYSMLGTMDIVGGENDFISENTYSLLDIMNGLIGRNLELEAERKNIDLSTQDIKTAKSNFLPNISASTTGTYIDPKLAEVSFGEAPEFTTEGSVELEQLVYSEAAAAGVTVQNNLQKAQQETYNALELDAILNGSVAYFNALILKTNAQIQARNLEVTKKNLEISEQNFQAGAAGKSDIFRFRSELAQNMQTLIEAGNQLSQSYYTINQLMNNPIAMEIDVQDANISEGLFVNYRYDDFKEILDNPKLRPHLVHFLIEEAKKNAPELKNIGYNLEATRRNYKLNNAGRFVPIVALAGGYDLEISRSGIGSSYLEGTPDIPSGYYFAALKVSLPIFNQNTRNINKQTAKIQEDQLNIQKANINLSIENNINMLILDLTNEIANIQISKVAEDAAKESLILTQNSYREGAVPLIQLIDAQTNYLQSQIARANANYNYLLASMQLERSIGYFFLMNSEESNQDFIQRARAFILSKN